MGSRRDAAPNPALTAILTRGGAALAKSTVHGSESARPGRATYQDVLDAPAHRVAEIVDGTLYVSPRPPTLQALAKTRLVAGLGNAFGFGRGGGPGGWRIMHEPELHLREDILVPDVAGWRRERLPRIPETWDAVIAPDWVCETLADSTRDPRSERQASGLRPRRDPTPVARRPDVLHPRGIRAPRWAVAPAREREGRRAGEHPPVRCDHLQPGRSLALMGYTYSGPLDRFAGANRKAGHRGARASPVSRRKPSRSAGCQGGRAGEAVFTYGLNTGSQRIRLLSPFPKFRGDPDGMVPDSDHPRTARDLPRRTGAVAGGRDG